MRILIVSNKVKTYSLGFQNILAPLIKLGHEMVWAADFSKYVADDIDEIPAHIESISITTNPLNIRNIKAFIQIRKIIKRYKIEGIYCATPIGGALARLAGKMERIVPVVYSAHGFLFFKGAPLINRVLFKLEEIVLAHYTDALVTITKEDYYAAQKFSLRSGKKPYIIHGAGVKVGVSVSIERAEKRRSIGLPEDAFVIVSAGELNKNKNSEVIVRALRDIEDAHYVACGVGPEKENLEKLARKLGVSERIHLLGYRTDMPEIMACADVFTMMSFREGMPRALLEAMDLGLPCVGSNTRGIRDLIDLNGGFICEPKDYKALAQKIKFLKENALIRNKMGEHNKGKVKNYSADVVRDELYNIFKAEFKPLHP